MSDREFCTLSEVKNYVGLKANDDDSTLAAGIIRATGWIENYTSRRFLLDSYSERRDATGNDTLILRNRPVVSVTSVQLGPPGTAPVTLAVNRDYWFDENGLVWLLPVSRARGNVLVAYTAGFDVLPWEIRDACIQIVAWRYKEGKRIAEKSKSVQGNEVISYQTDAVPAAVQKTLDQWTNPVYA